MLKSLFSRPLILACALLAGCNRVENQPAVAESPAANSVATTVAVAADVETESRAAEPSSPAGQADRPAKAIPAKADAKDDGAFRVMSWNLEWFFDNEGGDNYSELAKEQTLSTREQWDWKRDAVAKAIDQARPSLIGLQEIENKRVLFYLRRSLARNHNVAYQELFIEGNDFFTEQDVGLMYRSDDDTEATDSNLPIVDPIQVSMFGRSRAQRTDKTLTDVSKHLAVTFEVVRGDASEQVTIVNVHLRAKEEGIEIRTRQARLVHAWVAEKIKQGENVIVMGDLNTDESVFPSQSGSDMFAILGLETPGTEDDLIDLHTHLAQTERQTHLLKNKMFDRILVSPSLIEDDKSRVDLVFSKMQRMRELSVQGEVDEPQQHWDHYWEIDNGSRDISDHWPIMASFEWK